MSRNEFVDDEVEEEEEEGEVVKHHEDDEEEDDGEELDEFEKDDFIVDEEEEPQEEDEQRPRHKKRKRKKVESELDEEDLELLNENLNRSNQYKRICKKGAEQDDEANFIVDDEEERMENFIIDEEEGTYMDGDTEDHSRARRAKKSSTISSSALQEAREIFGDVSELLEHRSMVTKGNKQEEDYKKRLRTEYEPSLLEEKYLTESDERIREMDVPERLQYMMEMALPQADQVAKEAEWVYARMAMRFGHEEKADIMQQIANVLSLLHDNKEVPFIAAYRKELCSELLHEENNSSLLRYKSLWEVQTWDKKWLLLQKRKDALSRAFERRTLEGEARERLLQCVHDATSEVCLDDIEAKLNLVFPPDELNTMFKRPSQRRSLYSACRKHNLESVVAHLGLTPEQFGENLHAMYKKHEVENATSSPDEVASTHLAGEFSTVESVLKGMRHMAAVGISTEPAVREFVRNTLLPQALVSTRPTAEGKRVITDSFHQYAVIKWLRDKPVDAFQDAQWLLVEKAEVEKLLEVTITIPRDRASWLVHEFEKLYLSDGVSKNTQLWNEQRKQILNEALSSFLIPLMQKEVRVSLTSRCRDWIATECAEQLWRRVSVAPYGQDMKVMACCWGPGNPATTFVMLDSTGEIVDTLHAGYLTMSTRSYENEQRKKKDRERVMNFMMDHQPHVVVVGGANVSCKYLYDAVQQVAFKIVENHPKKVASEGDIVVVYVDETIPGLYELCELQEQTQGIVRRAAALGRFLQNPLAVTAALFGPSKEITSLKLHPQQDFLGMDELYEALERVMVTVTNQVGLDINTAASHEWLLAPLQFIAGLGPRKAAFLKREVQKMGSIRCRKDIYDIIRTKNVFVNCAGFIRVSNADDPLDSTRIHPESYKVAKKMAAYVMGTEQEDDEMAVEQAMNNPKEMERLNVREFATMVNSKLQTVQDMQREFVEGFREPRVKYRKPEMEEVLYMLTQESRDTLSEGKLVQATVKRVYPDKVLCTLECGLQGTIRTEDLSDEVSEGTILTCMIERVDATRFFLNLSSRGRDLRQENDRRVDPYYAEEQESDKEDKAKQKPVEQQKPFKARSIFHPRFKNCSLEEAVHDLSDAEVGEVIIRPSSKGPYHLAMTIKFYPGMYCHVEIVEGGKDRRDMMSLMRLGKKLTIGGESFEDLDEVIARYVDPLTVHWKNMFAYRKFKLGTREEVDNALKVAKDANPGVVPYFVSLCYEHPGVFTLSYIRSVNVHHEYVTVSHKGFRFRQRYFDSPDKLIQHFQLHFFEPPPEAAPRRASAAMVPPPRTYRARSGWDRQGRGYATHDYGYQQYDRSSDRSDGHTTYGRSYNRGTPHNRYDTRY